MFIEVAVDHHFFNNLESIIAKGGSFALSNAPDILEIELVWETPFLFTAEMLARFVQRLCAEDLKKYKTKITICYTNNLTVEQIIILLSNAYIANALTGFLFTYLISSSDDAARFALNCPYIVERLNHIKLKPDTQTFENSCAARIILKILRECGIISAAEDTRSKELEIYSQIWDKPGKDACPQKIIEFVKSIKKESVRKFNITSIEVADITQSLIQRLDAVVSENKDTNFIGVANAAKLKQAYCLFKAAKPDEFITVNKTDVSMNALTDQDYLLLIERDCGSAHVFLGKKTSDGKLSVFDPKTSRENIFESFNDYMRMKKDSYVGVNLNIRASL